jgi:predicted nucleic acid-binding protein
MNIVVDTNIVFSALIKTESAISNFILDQNSKFRFFTSEYLLYELDKHKKKLYKASKMTEKEMIIAKDKIFESIEVISIEIIPMEMWQAAEILTLDIDPDDISFVALAIYLDAYFWTGDKNLYQGLMNNGFDKVLLTTELNNKLFNTDTIKNYDKDF